MTMPPPSGPDQPHDWPDPRAGQRPEYPVSGAYGQDPDASGSAYQYSAPPYSGQPYSGQPNSERPPGPPYSEQPNPGQPYPLRPTVSYPVAWRPPGPVAPTYAPAAYGGAGTYGGAAPFGIDPRTGHAFSDKSKVSAGLLQLLPGFFLGLGGIGRLYAGNSGLGTIQLITTFVAWVAGCLGVALSVFIVPLVFLFVPFAAWVWFVVDGIVILAGHPTDGQGRPLRS